jgi:hypothetical protein
MTNPMEFRMTTLMTYGMVKPMPYMMEKPMPSVMSAAAIHLCHPGLDPGSIFWTFATGDGGTWIPAQDAMDASLLRDGQIGASKAAGQPFIGTLAR